MRSPNRTCAHENARPLGGRDRDHLRLHMYHVMTCDVGYVSLPTHASIHCIRITYVSNAHLEKPFFNLEKPFSNLEKNQ